MAMGRLPGRRRIHVLHGFPACLGRDRPRNAAVLRPCGPAGDDGPPCRRRGAGRPVPYGDGEPPGLRPPPWPARAAGTVASRRPRQPADVRLLRRPGQRGGVQGRPARSRRASHRMAGGHRDGQPVQRRRPPGVARDHRRPCCCRRDGHGFLRCGHPRRRGLQVAMGRSPGSRLQHPFLFGPGGPEVPGRLDGRGQSE